ncbi:MAG: hypothetical protein ACI4WH_02920 [Oscillospiraceae bacterium]
MGVTAVGMVVLSKKLNNISDEINQISKKLDDIDIKLVAIQLGIDELSENECRKLNREYNQLIGSMLNMIDNLNYQNYTDILDREAKDLLNKCNAFLNDMISRYIDKTKIVITMEQLMAFFTVYTSFSRVLLAKAYKHTGRVLNPFSYQNSIRSMCSNKVIYSLQEHICTSAESVLLPSDLNLIANAYKLIVSEKVKSIKSSEQIINFLPYNEFVYIDEELKSVHNKEIMYIEYN